MPSLPICNLVNEPFIPTLARCRFAASTGAVVRHALMTGQAWRSLSWSAQSLPPTALLLLLLHAVLTVCAAITDLDAHLSVQSLSGSGWRLHSENGSVEAAAEVPGSVYVDLHRAGLIPDPYYRDNEAACRWVANTSWSLTLNFTLSADMRTRLQSAQHTELQLDGVDTVAAISLNSQQLGHVNNMFRRWVFAVNASLLRAEGNNVLQVLLRSPVLEAAGLSAQYPYPLPRADPDTVHPMGERQMLRKSQVDWGWNNQPGFADVGIWRDVSLLSFDAAIIRDVLVVQQHAALMDDDARSRHGLRAGDVLLNVTAFLRVSPAAAMTGSASASLLLTVAGVESRSAEFALVAASSQSGDALLPVSVLLVVPAPALWWPRGLGAATLYNLSLSLLSDGELLHAVDRRVGFRHVEIVRQPDEQPGLTFAFRVNGLPLFIKGANVVPLDSFHARVTAANISRLLSSVLDANLNALRVWGGGIVQPELFYSLADANGLLVWQEFPFACSLYPVWPDFLSNVREETAQITRRLSSHPSVVVLGGNNENEEALTWFPVSVHARDLYLIDYNDLYVRTVRDAVVRELGGSVEFIVSSPSNGPLSLHPFTQRWGDSNDPTMGDVHFYLYDSDLSDPGVFIDARFVSEHGFPSHPSLVSYAPVTLPAEDWFPDSRIMQYRNRLGDGLRILDDQLRRHFLPPNSTDHRQQFHHYLYLVQCVHSLHYEGFLSKYRRSQSLSASSLRTAGVMYWMLNDAWPGPSKATLEWSGRWKLTHYAVMRAFQPQAISAFSMPGRDQLGVFLLNDELRPWTGSLRLQVRQWADGSVLHELVSNVTAERQSAQPVMRLSVSSLLQQAGCRDNSTCFVTVESEPALRPAHVFPAPLRLVTLPFPNISIDVSLSSPFASSSSSSSLSVRLSCSAPAAYLLLETTLSGRWADNGFLLLPDAPRTIEFESWEQRSILPAEMRQTLTVISVYDTIHPQAAQTSAAQASS